MRLRIEEIEVLLTRLDDCLVDGNLLGQDCVESAMRTDTKHVGKRPATHISHDQKNALAAGGDSLGQVDGNRSLSLVGNRRRNGNGADGVIHARKANVGQKGLGGILYNELIGVLSPSHAYLPPFIAGIRPTTGIPRSSSASSTPRMRVLSISAKTT